MDDDVERLMRRALHISKILFMIAITILFLSAGMAQASSVNIIGSEYPLHRETGAGSAVDWTWYAYNNETSSILLRINLDISENFDHVDGQSVYVDNALYIHGNGIQIDPGNGKNIRVVISVDKLSSTSIVEALVTMKVTNLSSQQTDHYDFALTIDVSSIYSGEDSFNKIIGVMENPLPPPLDNQWGALLISLIIYGAFAGALYFVVFPLVLKLPILRNRDIYRQIMGMLKIPVFVLALLYGMIESFYIIGADETYLVNINTFVNIIYIILIAKISWSLYEMFTRHFLIQYNLKRNLKNDLSLLPLLNWIGKVAVVMGAASAIFAALGFNIMIILTGAGILGLAISLGAQDTLNKFFSGLSLLIERPFKEGDLLQMDDGIVVEAVRVGLRSTTFYNTFDPQYFTIPNDIVANSKLVNVLRPDARYKAKVDIGVAYGSDITLVKKAMLQAAMDHPETLKTEKEMPMVRFMGFGDSSLNFRLFTWVNDFNDHYRILGELREAIDANFRHYDIEIPFPQRDIWIRKRDQEEPDE